MATLALAVAGSTIASTLFPYTAVNLFGTFVAASTIGFTVGSLIGSYIDSRYLIPAIFTPPALEGPRADDLGVTTASEGSPMNWAIGSRVRVGGTCIWKSDLIPVKTSQRVGGGKGGGGSKQRVNSYNYFVDVAIGLVNTEGLPGPVVRLVSLMANGKILYDGRDFTYMDDLTFYNGSQTAPDDLIESYEGAGAVPNFKHLCYVVLHRLAMTEFGNSIPNIEAILEVQSESTLSQGIQYVLGRAGLSPEEWDGSRLASCMKGYVVSGVQSVGQQLGPLLLAHTVALREVDGVLVGFSRGGEPVLDVDMKWLAAREEGATVPQTVRYTESHDLVLPSEVTIEYANVNDRLQRASQTAHRWDHPSRSNVNLTMPMTLDDEEAYVIAKRMLWSTDAQRRQADLTLPPRYFHLQEGSIIRLTDEDDDETLIWCRDIARGANYRLEISGTTFHPDAYSQVADIDEITQTPNLVYQPPELVYALGDLPALTNEHIDKIGLYYAVCAKDPAARWLGSALFKSPNNSDFEEVGTAPAEAIIGTIHAAPGAGPTTVWDTKNRIVVRVNEGALGPASDEEVLFGLNRCAIETPSGWEILAFAQASLIGPRTYELTRLLRGLRGTEHLVGLHENGSRFVFGELGPIYFADLGMVALGSLDWYKLVPKHAMVSSVEAERVRVSGMTQRPLSPCHVSGSWEFGDFTLSWVRRTKYITYIFSPGGAPMSPDELPEAYDVEFVYGPGDGPILRTVRVNEATTLLYTAAEQSSDGSAIGVPVTPGQTPIHARIYQISRTVGRGTPADRVFYPE